MSLHRLGLRYGGASQSRELLSHVYGRFGEGFDTADLQAAKQLLAIRLEAGEATSACGA
jgi:hypothetical protein